MKENCEKVSNEGDTQSVDAIASLTTSILGSIVPIKREEDKSEEEAQNIGKNKGNDDHDDNACKDSNFNVRIVKQNGTSVIINWSLIDHAEVYKIEKYHQTRGWEKVAWTSDGVATIENLEENFGYRLRLHALKVSNDKAQFISIQTSQEIMVTTASALPSTTCLQRAIKKSHRFLIKRILRRRPSLIEYPGPNGYLPLANAIAYSDMSVIDILLTAGASGHRANPTNKRTPLHVAFYYGRLSVARILVNKNAQLDCSDAMGLTACHMAIDSNQSEILKFAIDCGADLEIKDSCGWTLLLRAVFMHSDVSILKLLVIHGANMNAKDISGKNCVDLARLYRNEEALKYFNNVLLLRRKKQEESEGKLKSEDLVEVTS